MPEIILPIVFFISLAVINIKNKELQYARSARIAMATMLLFTGSAHFYFDQGMAMMLPDFVPHRIFVVYVTGFLEILAAVGMLLSKYQRLTGWVVILFFIAILPSNIYSAIRQVDMETATYNGQGLSYLWYRIPLQLFFISWVYISCVNQNLINLNLTKIFSR